MMNRFTSLLVSNRFSLKLTMGILSIISLLSTVTLSQQAHAQTPAEIAQYTSIVRQIEPLRIQAYARVKQLMKGNVPEDPCQQGNLPQDVRQVCEQFDKSSREIIKNSGMPISKFNEVARYCQQSSKPAECPK